MESDENLKKILSGKDSPKLSVNFEDRVMDEIHKSIHESSIKRRLLYLSWIFFMFGLTTGIVISTVLVNNETILYGINLADYKLYIQILCSTVIILIFEKIYKITTEMRNLN